MDEQAAITHIRNFLNAPEVVRKGDCDHYHDWLVNRYLKLKRPDKFVVTFDDGRGRELVALAEGGDRTAHKVVLGFAAAAIRQGAKVPSSLGEYVIAVLEGKGVRKPKPGATRHRYMMRNMYIRTAVQEAMDLGFPRERNPATKSPSACSIVGVVLGMTEGAVLKACKLSEEFRQ